MNNHQVARFTRIILKKPTLPAVLVFCVMGTVDARAQALTGQHSGVMVAVDWHTIAEPVYGVRYEYAWNVVGAHSKTGAAMPVELQFQISQNDGGGTFTLLSDPIAVPRSGLRITFDRHVALYPTAAERGTSLSNDPKDKCRNQGQGISRAVFHQVIDVIDAGTGKVLTPRVDEYAFNVSRHQVLNDIDNHSDITLDLSPFAGRRIQIRTRILAGYNGRGPAQSTTPTISFVTTATQEDLK